MLSIFLYIIFLFLLAYYLIFLSGILRGIKNLKYLPSDKIPGEFVSIIIPFRNESGNILKSLRSIETQNYPSDKFEVIYVDDSSGDDSLEKLSGSIKKENIKVVSVPKDFSVNAHKKRAVRFGIENSKGEIIVTTDADCIHDPDWLKSLLGEFDTETGFVSGPVEFMDDNNFFGKLQKIEFTGLVLTGAGLIGIKKPTICNAANIAYRRSVFNLVGGFKDNMNLSSGDDELLMQKISRDTKYKIKFCLERKAVVKTEANKSVKQFYHQRKRWASKGLFYADKFLILKLILIFLFYLSVFAELLLSVFYSTNFLILFLITLIMKFFLEYRIIKTGLKLLFTDHIMKYFAAAELLHIPYIIIAGVSGLFGNFTWKDRQVKR